MPTAETDIEINAPVERVFQHWHQYEKFPQFMGHIKEVRRIGNEQTHWVAEIAGDTLEWDARTEEEDNRRVAWTATGETGQSGEVLLERLGPDRTRVQVRIDYNLPQGWKEKTANVLKIDEAAVKSDLRDFKKMVEGGGS